MRDSKKLVGHLYAMFTILVWGSCFVLTKNLLAVGITAVQIIPLRMLLAYVCLLYTSGASGGRSPYRPAGG